MTKKAWAGVFRVPEPGRSMKPRTTGFTMVLDKGLGRYAVEDLMATAADYIDFLKLSFGTSAFYTERVVREKIEIATSAGVDVYPGGTFMEVTVWQNSYEAFLKQANELGFTAIEVSDGTLEMTDETRGDCIKRALDAGFKVVTEVSRPGRGVKESVFLISPVQLMRVRSTRLFPGWMIWINSCGKRQSRISNSI